MALSATKYDQAALACLSRPEPEEPPAELKQLGSLHRRRSLGGGRRCVYTMGRRATGIRAAHDLPGRGTFDGPRLCHSPVFSCRSLSFGQLKKKTNLWVSIDSGAPSNFIDKTLVQKIRLAVEPLPHPLLVSVLDGRLLGSGPIATQTSAITLCLGHHTKRVTQLPELHHILGFPWIQKHNPYIDCSTGSISVWGTQCTQSCLKGMVTPSPTKV